ncbi:MAG: Rha family transcriptional regulator [Veillonella caviae]|uniref:Rha family transcriptional regulator n=1 Tax=Veillonella caviae TaxID=248316 RepID=UPI002A915507|nr:Rha family transcriptional regulator [Veillonella caviae]MDY5480876.1 Rha family transcriptional regulator [Veillonella caviae]
MKYCIIGHSFFQMKGMDTMNQLEVSRLTLDSREVANMIDKLHNELLKDIRRYADYLTEGKIPLSDFWSKSTYKDVTGRTLKCYQITKKGCEFLAHKMTGKKGAIFTATYINRFHEMEEQLQSPKQTESLPSMVDIPNLLTYKGEPVITLLTLERLIGIDHATALWTLKSKQIPYNHLVGESLKEFKRENNYMDSASKLVIINRTSTCSLLCACKLLTDTVLIQIGAYFERLANTTADKVNTLELIRLNSMAKVIHYIRDDNARSSTALYITQCLANLGLWTGAITDEWCINTVDGWGKTVVLENSNTLLQRGKEVSSKALYNFEVEVTAYTR